MDHTAREKEKATITHSLPVTAKIPFCIQTGFSQHCGTLWRRQPLSTNGTYSDMSLQIELACATFHKMHNFVSLSFCTCNECQKRDVRQAKRQSERENEWLCSCRWVWLIWHSICGTGAVPHRMKINRGFLPIGHYNYWFSNPICHTHHTHKKMWLENLAASICYYYTRFHPLHFVEKYIYIVILQYSFFDVIWKRKT